MKTCPLCGDSTQNDTVVCERCDYQFKTGINNPDLLDERSSELQNEVPVSKASRPTGNAPITVGWICLGLSILILLLSFGQGPHDWEVSSARALAGNPYASAETFSRVTDAYARQLMMQMIAGGFFSLFLVFWSVGSIINALSYIEPSGKGSSA